MRVYLARGEMDAARNAFHQAETSLAKTCYNQYRRDVYVIVDWVQFCLASGAMDRATRWTEELVQQTSGPSPLARERQNVAQARILLAQHRPTEVLSLLEPLNIIAEQQERLSHAIEIYMLQALAYRLCQQEQEALSALAQAVRLAEPEGYIRCFVDEGSPMAALLSRLREQEREHRPTPYLDTVMAAFASSQHNQKVERWRTSESDHTYDLTSPLFEPLSDRELEVLRLMEQGASNQEIAENLVLALSTVKSHVRTILSKLGARNRTQAVKRARSLGLLSDQP